MKDLLKASLIFCLFSTAVCAVAALAYHTGEDSRKLGREREERNASPDSRLTDIGPNIRSNADDSRVPSTLGSHGGHSEEDSQIVDHLSAPNE